MKKNFILRHDSGSRPNFKTKFSLYSLTLTKSLVFIYTFFFTCCKEFSDKKKKKCSNPRLYRNSKVNLKSIKVISYNGKYEGEEVKSEII